MLIAHAARSAMAGGVVAAVVLAATGCSADEDTALASPPAETGAPAVGSQELRVEFTGDDCVYSGPTEFTLGDTINITAVDVAEERNSVGYTLSKVADGTTVADAQRIADDPQGDPDDIADNSDDTAETYLQHQITEQGTERTLSYTLDIAGTWLLDCFIAYEATFPATTFEVVE